MDRILPALRDDYLRWRGQLRLDNGGEVPYTVRIDDVLRGHYLLCDYFIREGEEIASAGPRDSVLLGSAISRQGTGFGPVLKWTEPLDQVATLFYGLAKNHAFHDGNKRTALLTALYHLRRLGKEPAGEQREFEGVAVRTAADQLEEYAWYDVAKKRHEDEHDRRVFVLSKFFRRHSRDVDKRFYTVTFNQLDTILRKFNFRLAHPSGNFIDVVRDVEVRRFFGFKRKTEEAARDSDRFSGLDERGKQKRNLSSSTGHGADSRPGMRLRRILQRDRSFGSPDQPVSSAAHALEGQIGSQRDTVRRRIVN